MVRNFVVAVAIVVSSMTLAACGSATPSTTTAAAHGCDPRLDTNLSGCHLAGANLAGLDLQSDNLRQANLSGANLDGANLQGATTTGANLKGVITNSSTICTNAVFGPCDQPGLRGDGHATDGS